MAIYNPVLPYVGPIGGTLLPGRSVRIHGTVHPGATRFAINLQSGPNLYPRDDVAVHISADFIRNCIVRNNILNMNWGPEESHGHFPLARGQPFDITIHCERDCYKIHINGSHYTDFIHRIPYERVSYFSVDGDVTVNSIEYSGGHGYGHGHSGGHMPMPIPVPMVYPGAPGHVPLPPPGPHGYYPPPYDKKLLKSQKKAHKKALKYGLPIAGIAGAGVGAYALHKGFHHHGHHHSSSSSSSSSSSEEE